MHNLILGKPKNLKKNPKQIDTNNNTIKLHTIFTWFEGNIWCDGPEDRNVAHGQSFELTKYY